MGKSKKAFLMILAAALTLPLVFLITVAALLSDVPNEIFLIKGNTQTIDFDLPFALNVKSNAENVVKLNGNSLKEQSAYELDAPITISTQNTGTADISFDVLGIFPVKNITVRVVEEKELVAGGQNIGVMLYTKGALVVGSMDIETEGGRKINPAAEAGLRAGDVIEMVNDIEINNAAHLSQMINDIDENSVRLRVSRGGEEIEMSVMPIKDAEDGMYKLGVWVRDSTAGVGTLTFYDPETNNFAGLGHAISDADTGQRLTVKEGEIIASNVIEIVKGEAGEPGEIKGSFADHEVIGRISKNTDYGIYGTGEEAIASCVGATRLLAAKRDETRLGGAYILCTLDDGGVKAYSCNITKLNEQHSPGQKSMELEITDERLLELTGGIIQGMSGSPIIQNGKLIGAVTHVFVNDPTKGYGIYVDWMLNELPN